MFMVELVLVGDCTSDDGIGGVISLQLPLISVSKSVMKASSNDWWLPASAGGVGMLAAKKGSLMSWPGIGHSRFSTEFSWMVIVGGVGKSMLIS